MRITIEMDERERAAITAALLDALNGANGNFTPPTLDEVRAYADTKEWEPKLFDPVAFHRYNELRGWHMRDWKQAAAGWYDKQRHLHPELERPDYSDTWGDG